MSADRVRLPALAPMWGLKPNGAARACGTRFSGFNSHLSLQVGRRTTEGGRLPCKQDNQVSSMLTRSTNVFDWQANQVKASV